MRPQDNVLCIMYYRRCSALEETARLQDRKTYNVLWIMDYRRWAALEETARLQDRETARQCIFLTLISCSPP